MTRIILLRHGQTKWNEVERFRGRFDIELDETGEKQADAASLRIARWQVSAVFSSPLKRTLRTAQPVAQRFGLTVQPSEALIDIHFGDWQGLSPEEVEAVDGDLYKVWLKKPHLVQFPGGETLEHVRKRAVPELQRLSEYYNGQTIVLVSHKVVCKVIVCSVLGLKNSDFWRVEQDVCAINIFEKRNGLLVATLVNDTCHLRNLDT